MTVAVGAAAFLFGCNRQPSGPAADHRGRYVGIGIFSVGELWSRMVVATSAKGAASATIADDEHIIVVVDSRTGEIRQCGDHSGVCVSFNPWTKATAPPQQAPVSLTKHAAELAAENNTVDSRIAPLPDATER